MTSVSTSVFASYKYKLLNIRTGEVQTLNHSSPLVDEIMVMILKAKFEKYVPKSDEEFIRDCLGVV